MKSRRMKLIVDVEKDYYEIIKYNVEQGKKYKPWEIIANGIPFKDLDFYSIGDGKK